MRRALVSVPVLLLSSLPAQSPGFWEVRPSLAIARQEVGAAVLNGQVYVAGGLTTGAAGIASVERYDPATGMWTPVPPLPTTRHHFGMAATGGVLYVIGGYVQSFVGDARCYSFDPAVGQWVQIASLPRARGALAAVALGGKIYAVGGLDRTRGVVGALTEYDPATNQWRTLAPMAAIREHLAAAVVGGRLYVAGGRVGGTLSNALECFDPSTGQWTTRAPMPTARGGNGAAALDGKLIVVGGEGSALPGGNFPQAEEYDPQTDSWRPLRNMNIPLHGIYPVTVGNEILVAGGGIVAGLGATNVVVAFRRLPTGVASYGASTPACNGAISMFPSAPPVQGSGLFGLQCSPNAPPLTSGAIAVGAQQDVAGTLILGMSLHVGLTPPVVLVPVSTDARGAAGVAAPLPPGTAGLQFFGQFLWLNTPGCPGPGTLSSSDALATTVQATGS